MDVGDIDPGVRGVIIEKIYQSIADLDCDIIDRTLERGTDRT